MLSAKLYASYKIVNNQIPNEPLVDRFTRELAIRWACQSGNEDCLMDSLEQVRLVVNQTQNIPKGLEEVIYCSGLKGVGKKDEWIGLWRRMQNSSDLEERSLIIKALGCTEDDELLKSYLEASLGANSDTNFRSGERLLIFNSITPSSVGVKTIVEFLTLYEVTRT